MEDYALCLIGEAVDGSPSPAMQEAALAAAGLRGHYEPVSVSPTELPSVVRDLRAGRWRGANVTAPYKFALASVCDDLDGDARLTGAVNTLVVDESGSLTGCNTDALGFERALSTRRLWPLPEARALVLGAGGAAAAVLLALARAPALRVTLAARRINAARALADSLAEEGVEGDVAVALWDEDYLRHLVTTADIVVNATPAGIAEMPFQVEDLAEQATVADLRYAPRPVDLVEAAAAAGRRACDGAEMLLQQGMLSFQLWTGIDPPHEEARRALDEALQR